MCRFIAFSFIVLTLASCGDTLVSSRPDAPFILDVTAGNGESVIRFFDREGMTYTLYVAAEPGVTRRNWSSLDSGMMFTDVHSPYSMRGFRNGVVYYCVLTAMDSRGRESVESGEWWTIPEAWL